MANTGDPMVLATQHWLNVTYGQYVESGRFNLVAETGKTGWPTIYALTRALQIEYGITNTADNFGPTTQGMFESISRNDLATNNFFAIIQGALWCKGYDTGHYGVAGNDGRYIIDNHFDESVEDAIKQLELDAGRDNPDGIVDLNIMMALLSMDAFKCITAYGGNPKVRVMQQYLNKNYENYIGLRPCDGIYGRRTNTALIYALQAEEKMPTSVANGNFGPSTRNCCPTIPYTNLQKDYRGNVYSEASIKKFNKLMQIGMYVNGCGTGALTDNFDSTTLNEFQEDYGLQVNGICSLTTWLSLFTSCGDTSRSAIACDCATILTNEKAQTLFNNGYRYVGRYLSGTIGGGISKALTVNELKIAFSHGLRVFPIQQGNNRQLSDFTIPEAEDAAENALKYATLLGIPKGTIIYFAVDFDPQDSEITSYIIPYFKRISELLKTYRIGIYGTRNVCTRVSNLGYAVSSFVSDMSTGWSGNLGFKIPENWAFDQFATITIGSGLGQIEIDKDGYSGKDSGFNQITDQTTRMAENFRNIFNLAMEYTSNNKTRSNELVLHYFRKRGNYGGSIFSGSSDTALTWNSSAGSIDNTFCDLVDSQLGNLHLSFYDPVTKSCKYDINHLCATCNALLYVIGDSTNPGLDILTNLYAGWGGDMLSFAKNVKKADQKGETDLVQWSKNNICTEVDTYFTIDDYYADIDAVNIVNMMSQYDMNFADAFEWYFNTPLNEQSYAQQRTTRYMNSVGGATYIEDMCDLLNDDDLDIFAIILGGTLKQEYFDAAIAGFKHFIYAEYTAGR